MNKHTSLLRPIPWLLLAILAVYILQVLLSGINLSRSLAYAGNEARIQRTAAQYLTVRLEQASTGSLSIGEFHSTDALEFTSGGYITRIYCHDGWLRELYCTADTVMTPDSGEPLLPMNAMELEYTGNLLTVRMVFDSDSLTLAHHIGDILREVES